MLYVLSGCKEEEINWPSAEKDLKTPKEDYSDILGENKDKEPQLQLHRLAYREWMEWRLVEFLDNLGSKHKLKDVIKHMLKEDGRKIKELKKFLILELEEVKEKKDFDWSEYMNKYGEFLKTLLPNEKSGDLK